MLERTILQAKQYYHRIRPPQLHLFLLRASTFALPIFIALFLLSTLLSYYLLLPLMRSHNAATLATNTPENTNAQPFATISNGFPVVNHAYLSTTATTPSTTKPYVSLPQIYPVVIRQISLHANTAKQRGQRIQLFASVFNTGGIPSVGTPDSIMLGALQYTARTGDPHTLEVFLLSNTTSKTLNRNNAQTMKKLRLAGVTVHNIPEPRILSRFPAQLRPQISRCLRNGVFVVASSRSGRSDSVAHVVYSEVSPRMLNTTNTPANTPANTPVVGFKTSTESNIRDDGKGVAIYLSLC